MLESSDTSIASGTQRFLFVVALLGSAIVPAAVLSVYLFSRALPWWLDGGNWLKHMHAILGNSYPMWNEGTWQYPPLFMLIIAGLSRVVSDEIVALNIGAILAFSMRPLTTYVLVKELFQDRLSALAAAWLAAFTPVFVEMMGWGVILISWLSLCSL